MQINPDCVSLKQFMLSQFHILTKIHQHIWEHLHICQLIVMGWHDKATQVNRSAFVPLLAYLESLPSQVLKLIQKYISLLHTDGPLY